MKTKFITSVLLSLLITSAGFCAEESSKDDASFTFTKNFYDALGTNDQAKVEELVRQTDPQIVYDAVIELSGTCISLIDEGKSTDAGPCFVTAGAMAIINARVHKKEGLLELVRIYEAYTSEQARGWMNANYLVDQGNFFYNKGNWAKAWHYYTQARPVFLLLGDKEGGAMVIASMGDVNYREGVYQMALENYQLALKIYQEVGNAKGEAKALKYIELVNKKLGK